MLKAMPAMDGARRFLYLEASNEGVDQQDEVVAAKALAESADWFKQYGNIDLEHYTLIGRPNQKTGSIGIPGCELYEIGKPLEVRQTGKTTFVKAEIYSGVGPTVEKANNFWASLVDQTPAQRWYPSVAGQIMEKAIHIDPGTKAKRAVIKKVRWQNIGMSKTPVSQHVPTCAVMPFGAFAKCWNSDGLDFAKALTAGYGTDSASLSGGAALRTQSLDTRVASSYFNFREQLSAAITAGLVGADPGVRELVAYAEHTFGMSPDEAAEWVERFSRDLKTGLKKRSKQ